jgi:hypothetical protein
MKALDRAMAVPGQVSGYRIIGSDFPRSGIPNLAGNQRIPAE